MDSSGNISAEDWKTKDRKENWTAHVSLRIDSYLSSGHVETLATQDFVLEIWLFFDYPIL